MRIFVVLRGDTSSVVVGCYVCWWRIFPRWCLIIVGGRRVSWRLSVALRGDTSSVRVGCEWVLRGLVGFSRVGRGVVPNTYFFRGAHDAVTVRVQAKHLRHMIECRN